MHYVLVSFVVSSLLGCNAASSGDNILKEHTHTASHLTRLILYYTLVLNAQLHGRRNSPWIGSLQHINKGLQLVPECITDCGLALTCPSGDSSPTGGTHPCYCGTKEVLTKKGKDTR
jgi:hypothetical protein